MTKKLLLALMLLFLALPIKAQAEVIQSDPSLESIERFHSSITVNVNGMINVDEAVRYNMDGVAHHGLERRIPAYQPSGDKYNNYKFTIISVSEDGNSGAKYNLTQQDNWYQLRIGDPDQTKTGVHDYTISYTYGPISTQTDKGDLFDYNVFGTGWVLPAKNVSASINFPVNVTVLDAVCFSGFNGSRQHDCEIVKSLHNVQVAATRTLKPYEGIDLQVLLTKGSFTSYTTKTDKPAKAPMTKQTLASIGAVLLFASIVFMILGSFIFQRWKEHRAKKRQTIIPQYESPDGLSPAEVGMLIDKSFSTGEIVATLVDLAIRGYVRIRETKPKSWFRKAEYEVDLLKPATEVKNYESQVLNLIFEPSHLTSKALPVTAPIKKNSSTKSQEAFKSMTKQIETNLRDKSYFEAKKRINAHVLKVMIVLGIVALIAILVIMAVIFENVDFIAAVLYTVIIVISTLFKDKKYTQLGYQQWAKVKGFEWFLTVTEKDRMKFENAPAKTPALFNKLLPYAIALGVEKKWAKQFEAINLGTATDWYVGSAASYSAIGLTSGLSSGFSSVVSSSVVPSANSGGFGGGGAGGGAGGGGGGGW